MPLLSPCGQGYHTEPSAPKGNQLQRRIRILAASCLGLLPLNQGQIRLKLEGRQNHILLFNHVQIISPSQLVASAKDVLLQAAKYCWKKGIMLKKTNRAIKCASD